MGSIYSDLRLFIFCILKISVWCNGNTAVSKTVIQGSSPCTGAKLKAAGYGGLRHDATDEARMGWRPSWLAAVSASARCYTIPRSRRDQPVPLIQGP